MNIRNELLQLKNDDKAVFVAHYFKTGKGEYGEGDVFWGLTVPQMRAIAKKYKDLPLTDVETLLHDKVHECRLTALLILCAKFTKAPEGERKQIVDLYIRNTKYINNWDLVDLSSHEILGTYLLDKPKERKLLYAFARSKNLWEKRIAIISTFEFLRVNDFIDALAIGEIMLHDSHDLIHKAVGWMLREVGKRDLAVEEAFLLKHYRTMPRTMLRYAIEKFSPNRKAFYMTKGT
jgi:3-methyladenine DNA glycosylase AlkD